MAVTLHTAGTMVKSASAGTSIVPTVPTNTNGDLLVLTLASGTGTTVSTPAGWSVLVAAVVNTGQIATFYRTAASEPASYTITVPSAKWTAVIDAWSGVNVSSPLDASTPSTSSVVPPAVTTVTDGSVVVGVGACLTASGVTDTWSSTDTMLSSGQSTQASSSNTASGSAYKLATTHGSFTPALTVSGTNTQPRSLTYALRPVATFAGAAALTQASTLTTAGLVAEVAAAALTQASTLTTAGLVTVPGTVTPTGWVTANGSGSTVTIPTVSGIAATDLVVALVTWGTSATFTPPAGWTQWYMTPVPFGSNVWIGYAVGGQGTLSASFSGGVRWSAQSGRLVGVDTAAPLVRPVVDAGSQSGTTALNVPDMDTTLGVFGPGTGGVPAFLLYVWAVKPNTTGVPCTFTHSAWPPPAEIAQDTSSSGTLANTASITAYTQQATPGVTAGSTGTLTASTASDARSLVIPIAPAWYGVARLTAQPNLTAGALVTEIAAAALSQASTLTTAGLVTEVAAAALTQTSSLTSGALVTALAAADLTQPATLTAAGTGTVPAAAALTQPATLTTAAAVTEIAAADLTQPATLTAAGFVTRFAAAALTQPAALTTDATVTALAAVALTQLATLTAEGHTGATAFLAQPATLTAGATVTALAAAALTQAATLTAAALVTETAAVALTALATLTSTGDVSVYAAGALTALATLHVVATAGPPQPGLFTGATTGPHVTGATGTARMSGTTSSARLGV